MSESKKSSNFFGTCSIPGAGSGPGSIQAALNDPGESEKPLFDERRRLAHIGERLAPFVENAQVPFQVPRSGLRVLLARVRRRLARPFSRQGVLGAYFFGKFLLFCAETKKPFDHLRAFVIE